MEKKTIGQFIATLRKANGMTQKQLAEKLSVTDKAVSRWERDESYPDLTLIPVIAEIFNVSSDEILRGEKKNVESIETTPRQAEKTERQIENILSRIDLNFGINTIISIAIAIIGLIVTMIVSIGLDEKDIGFYVGCAFYVFAVVCEVIFAMRAWHSISNEEYESDSIWIIKRRIVKKAELAISITITLFFYCLPLVVGRWYEDEGVNFGDWFGYAIVFVPVCIVICIFVVSIVNVRFAKVVATGSDEITNIKKRNHMRIKYMAIAVVAVGLCLAGMLWTNYLPVTIFTKGDTFYSIEDFIEYMETPYSDNGERLIIYHSDEYESICGKGYEVNNEYVYEIEPIEYNEDGSFYSITTYTHGQIMDGYSVCDVITSIWTFLALGSSIVLGVIYKRRVKKLYN